MMEEREEEGKGTLFIDKIPCPERCQFLKLRSRLARFGPHSQGRDAPCPRRERSFVVTGGDGRSLHRVPESTDGSALQLYTLILLFQGIHGVVICSKKDQRDDSIGGSNTVNNP